MSEGGTSMLRAQPTFSRDRCELVTRTNAHTHSRALGSHLARLHTEAGSAAALTPPTFNPPNGTGRVRHEWRRPERAQHACTLVCTHEHARPRGPFMPPVCCACAYIAARELRTQPVPTDRGDFGINCGELSARRAVQHSRWAPPAALRARRATTSSSLRMHV